MGKFSLADIKKVHFIGIGGSSMSGLAEILNIKGLQITGSDSKETDLTMHLRDKGIEVFIGQAYENVPKDCGLAVYTAAVKEDNPEILAAKDLGINIIDRAELLGKIMESYKYSVGVSGTHGKTTTTSMVSEILIESGFDPTLNMGGIYTAIGSNFRIGEGDYFVAESCEYFDSFAKFYPYVGIILNIEYDHTDYFKSMEQLENSFRRFAMNISENGLLVINNKTANLDKITENLKCRIITFGEGGDYRAENISYDENGKTSFDVFCMGKLKTRINLNMNGIHNVENALAAFIACEFLGAPSEKISAALGRCAGAKRRFEQKGEFRGVKVIDDYAHHPTAITATLSAAKKAEHNRIIAVFQPHTYSRTKEFLNRFAQSLTDADIVVIMDIYSAREVNDHSVHSLDIVKKVKDFGKEVYYFDNFEKAENFLRSLCMPNDLLITLGAGDVNIIGENILLTELSTLSTDKK